MAISYVTGMHVTLNFPERGNLEEVFAPVDTTRKHITLHVIKSACCAKS
jgi:hypothetical protein